MLDLDHLEEELLEEEDARVEGCGFILAGGFVCGKLGLLCFKCNHGDGVDPRLPEHLKFRRRVKV